MKTMENFQRAWVSLEKVLQSCEDFKREFEEVAKIVRSLISEAENVAKERLEEMSRLDRALTGLRMMHESGYLPDEEFKRLSNDLENKAEELQKLAIEAALEYNKKLVKALNTIKKLFEREEEWIIRFSFQ